MKRYLLIIPLAFVLLGGCGDKNEPVPTPSGAPPAAAKIEAPKAVPSATASAASPGSTTRATELKDKPFLDAKTLRTLPANSALTVFERQGGWMRVRAAGQDGWVRMLNVRTGAATVPAGTDPKSVAALATGRAGTGNIVATSGIRGLNEEQLRTAQGDLEQLKKLEGYAVSKQDAAQYAAKHGLKARLLAYLPAPGEQ